MTVRRLRLFLLLGLFLFIQFEPSGHKATRINAAYPHIGYGVNAFSATDSGIQAMGFDWTKAFGGIWWRFPHRVLRRVDVNADTLNDLNAWGDWLEAEAAAQAPYVEAWEIGNEPNLGVSYGWNAPPNAADYTRVLCEAYTRIKRADPSAVVVSAGLAVTGRIPFTWNGHKGYCAPGIEWCPIYYQDEREFLREMLAVGAGACFDALGFHPYGFGAPATAAPGSPECGPNDFCFRTVEVAHSIMADEFGVNKPVWATEFGWLVDPRQVGESSCWNDPVFSGWQWQVVSPEQQAQYLRDAYTYADANYPWMQGMFVFDYGFREGMTGCDPMRFFDIKGRPAESALASLSKNKVPVRVSVPSSAGFLVDVNAPTPQQGALRFQSQTYDPIAWSVESVSSPAFTLTVHQSAGSEQEALTFTVDPTGLGVGTYNATIQVRVRAQSPLDTTVPTENDIRTITITLHVVETIHRVALPFIAH